ncbi:hypothetical protein [Solilutibacter tolerans]|uniref:Uncharacterized protein n=1 Tax=Solilutibacter tolerans TaxID=1604334 RepID=A0A1N6PKG1_9GAMM|nr:hypothetical protein [Lysobacter tolerans]SIQ04786.1 hypothetical protein SAMN05421546_0648 [Lysobacter tolerans]
MKLNASLRRLAICLGASLLCAAPLQAQETQGCPQLPANSVLQWQEIRNPDLLFCKAMDANGRQAFTVMVSHESPFNPVRSQRAESTSINGQKTWWYRTEIATRPELLAREAAIELSNGNVAYFNVQANNDADLQQAYSTVAALSF